MNKKQTKQKIKEISLKIINIIGYVCIGLVLVLGILTGVNSCKNSKDQSAKTIQRNDINERIVKNNNPNAYQYYFNHFTPIMAGESGYSTIGLDFYTQANLIDMVGGAPLPGNPNATGEDFLNFGFGSGVAPVVNLYWYPTGGNAYLINNDGQLIPLYRVYLEFTAIQFSSGNSVYYYRLASIRTAVPSDNGVITGGNYRGVVRNYGTYANDYSNYRAFYGVSSDLTYIRQYLAIDNGVTLPDWLLFFFYPMYGGFNLSFQEFNPNAYFGYGKESIVVFDDNLTSDFQMMFNNGNGSFFYSNGELFNQIVLYWKHLNAGATYQDLGNTTNGYSTIKSGVANAGYFSTMEYWNTWTGRKVVICRRDLSVLGGLSAPTNRIMWYNNQAYRDITYYNMNSFSYETNINAFLEINNNYTNYDYGFDNPFTLIYTMFSALAPIFNIEVLPYVSIGVLIAVPLIAIIIFAIVSLLKK